jgi:hypothetical protein
MNRLKIHLIVVVIVTGLFTCTFAQAEVKHRQINAQNLVVDVSDDSWQPEGFEIGLAIPAAYLENESITLDGKDDEPAWDRATEVEVPLAYGDTKTSFLKALYTDKDVFIRVRWADDNEDREHHPWVWDAEQGKFVEGAQVEDSLLLSFEAGCEWTPSLLAGYIYDFDGWHWQAARSDPLGQALDLYGNVQDQDMGDPNYTRHQSRSREDTWVMKFTENSNVDLHAQWNEIDRIYMHQPVTKTLFVKAVPDSDGRHVPAFVEQLDPPTAKSADVTQTYPQFSPVKLPDGAGEVDAKGHWEDGFWTVEFRRDRVTPARTLNDTVFNRLVQFSVHVFDRTEQIDEVSESDRLFLQFMPQESQLAKD